MKSSGQDRNKKKWTLKVRKKNAANGKPINKRQRPSGVGHTDSVCVRESVFIAKIFAMKFLLYRDQVLRNLTHFAP